MSTPTEPDDETPARVFHVSSHRRAVIGRCAQTGKPYAAINDDGIQLFSVENFTDGDEGLATIETTSATQCVVVRKI